MATTEAVCFDLDGTLCRSVQSYADVHAAVFDRVDGDPPFDPADVRAVDGSEVATAESDAEFYRNLYEATLARVDDSPTVSDDRLWRLGEATAAVVDPTAVSLCEGAETALAHVRERYAVGLITNGGEATQTTKLETLGLADAFDTAVFCDPAAGVEPKPATEPFERALDALPASPATTVYVGDSLRADVAGAHRAGLRSVWVSSADDAPADGPTPTHSVDSLTELPTLL